MKYLVLTLCLGAAVISGCSRHDTVKPAPATSTGATAPAGKSQPVKLAVPDTAKPPTQEQISERLTTKFDVNKDGSVSQQEMLSVTVGDLLKHSARKDKTLTSDEFHTALGDKTGKDADISKVFDKVDTNHDKSLSQQEVSEYVWPSIVALNQPTAQKPISH
jgi:hypothetical protein